MELKKQNEQKRKSKNYQIAASGKPENSLQQLQRCTLHRDIGASEILRDDGVKASGVAAAR